MLPIAPFPPASLHAAIPDSAYSAWTTALSLHLQLPRSKFTSQSLTDTALCTFLHTYLHAAPTCTTPSSTDLKRKVLTLLHRILTLPDHTSLPSTFTSIQFLRDASSTFPRSRVLRSVLDEERIWRRFEDSATRLKRVVVAARGAASVELAPLFRFSGRTAETFLAGDEWVEVADVREFTVAVVAVAGREGPRKTNWSLVTDTVYGLVAAAEGTGGTREKGFLKALVETTVVVRALRRCARGTPEEGRVESMLKALEKFGRPKVKRVGKVEGNGKGKGKLVGLSEEDEIAVMRKVADIRDIFPDLGSGFVRRCLDAFNGDVERVTSALLENNLPPGLQHANQSEEYIPPDISPAPPAHPPPPALTRHNKFDNDALSTLSPAALVRLHIGRKNTIPLDADRSTKSSIFAALAAFDSGDDERDDTYDATDVVGTGPYEEGGEPERTEDSVDRVLWAALQTSPAVFERDAETRRSGARRALRDATGWSDEAVEGWHVMLGREPKRMEVLARKFGDSAGAPMQSALERTAWDGDEEDGGGRGRGRGRGRGIGGGGGGGGGRGRGAPEETTQRDRARKEAGKGGRANHNRRDQRARKMARGGFPG